MAKIVLTLLDGKVLTRDNKVIGSESGCCCCFCSETCERCIITDVEFTGITPPLYQMLDKTAYAPQPSFCSEIRIVVSKTTFDWTQGDNPNYVLDTAGNYAEEILYDGTRKYKTKQAHPMTSTGRSRSLWQNNTYVDLPDKNLYEAYVSPSGACGCDPTRAQLYLFCLKGDGTDGPFAKIPTVSGWTIKPKKIFNIDIDLHECGWVFVVQYSTCGQSVDADSSCSMNFARIPSDETGCPEVGNYNTVATFLSPTEIAAKDPPIECPDDHEDKLEDENENGIQDEDEEVPVVCENDTKKDPGVYEIADCDDRQDSLWEKGVYWDKAPQWPRTQGSKILISLTTAEWASNDWKDETLSSPPSYYEERLENGEKKYKTGTALQPKWAEAAYVDELPIIPSANYGYHPFCSAPYQWGAKCIPYRIWVRKTLRKTTVSPNSIGTTLCCVPDDPGFRYYFISQGPWTTLSNWRVINSFGLGIAGSSSLYYGCPGGLECGAYCEDDLPEYYCTKWLSGGVVPTMLPGPFDRVVIQESVTIPSDTKVLSMHVVGSVVPNAPKLSIAGTISTTDFSLFSHSAELTGQLLGKGKVIFAKDSIVSSVGVIGHATKTNDFTLIKFKNNSINNGKIYNRLCNIDGQTSVPQSIQRFVEFHDESSNAAVGSVNYTPAKFYGYSTNKGIICKDFGKGAGTTMDTLVENEGYPRSFFYDHSTNIAGATVVGAASFYDIAQNLGTINNEIDPYADKSINSAKFYGLVIGNAGGDHSENGPTGEILGYADFYDNSANYGDVIKDLTLHDYSSCGYKAGNDEDAINVGGDLIMRNKSGLGGAKIKIVGSLTTGTLGSLTENPTIFTSNIEVANNTNLYSQTQVRDSQILCTTDNKTMTINDTSIILPSMFITEKTNIKYAIVIFNDNADNSGKIIPYSSPNTTTFNDSSINRSEDIVGVLTFNDNSRNVVESDLVATYISVTFNDDSANMKNLFAFDPELCSPSFDSELCSPSSSSSSSP